MKVLPVPRSGQRESASPCPIRVPGCLSNCRVRLQQTKLSNRDAGPLMRQSTRWQSDARIAIGTAKRFPSTAERRGEGSALPEEKTQL
jgi:hypothetical protein